MTDWLPVPEPNDVSKVARVCTIHLDGDLWRIVRRAKTGRVVGTPAERFGDTSQALAFIEIHFPYDRYEVDLEAFCEECVDA